MKGAYVRAPKLRPREGTPHIADRMLGLRRFDITPLKTEMHTYNNVKMVPYDIPTPALCMRCQVNTILQGHSAILCVYLSIQILCGSSMVKIITKLLMTSNAVGTDMNATLLMKW